MPSHEDALASAFDAQAAQFERAPVQTDPAALERLVQFAELPPDSEILDVGCGPGLVSTVLLAEGHRVVGIDLSAEMIERARLRCANFGSRAHFEQRSLFDPLPWQSFDAVISRYVLHHTPDASAFIERQAALLRPGGILMLSDHTTDPVPSRADWHQELERDRDRTHQSNWTAGAIVDLFATAGLEQIRLCEESFALDFDEWFDRGTPSAGKGDVRRRLLAGPGARGFHPREQSDGTIRIDCWRALVRGVRIEQA